VTSTSSALVQWHNGTFTLQCSLFSYPAFQSCNSPIATSQVDGVIGGQTIITRILDVIVLGILSTAFPAEVASPT